jgi:hypothetical protein
MPSRGGEVLDVGPEAHSLGVAFRAVDEIDGAVQLGGEQW